jgi:gas vesicle structural protein
LKRVDFMTVAAQSRNRYLDRPAPSSLADVLDTILDEGLVIDIYVRVSLLGIELLTIDARIVIASVDTYLRFAEAVNRLAIAESDHKPGLTELVGGEDARQVSRGKTEGRTGTRSTEEVTEKVRR